PRQSSQLESTTDDIHTRNLLFPDAATLHQTDWQYSTLNGSPLANLPANSAFDGAQGEIDLEQSRDIRIIIAQDESGTMPKTVLFDSKPGLTRAESPTHANPRTRLFGPNSGSSTAGPTFGGSHARRASLVTETATPRSPTVGAFQRARGRGSSISSMPNIDEHTQGRTKESADLMQICLDCMFGNTPMAYRGPSNKLHIVPLEPRQVEPSTASPHMYDGTSSFGRAEGRRKSHLAKSYTPSNPPSELPQSVAEVHDSTQREPRRRTVLITRTFSVEPPEEEHTIDTTNTRTPTPQNSLGKGNGFPFPPSTHGGSSLDSDRRAGWTVVDSNFGVDSLLSASLSSDVDDRVDVIGQHMDVITRTLTSLQSVVHDRILAHFKGADVGSPPIFQQPRVQAGRLVNQHAPPPQTRRYLNLKPNVLAFDKDIKAAVELAGDRVVRGMRIPRVVTGQGRWGVWREEARLLEKMAGGRDQDFFFFKLLTAFLGNHTEWLNILGPKWYRRRHREQQRSTAGNDLTISSRTVIISDSKMVSRRLIFLLAAFMPSSSHALSDEMASLRPSTSASFRAYSQSPPSNMPVSRQQSLRRTINRRGKQSYTNMRQQPTGAKGNSLSTLESADDKPELHLPPAESLRPRHSRQPSARSIRTSLVIPSMSDSTNTTASSAATTSTVTSDAALPVAHFTVPRTPSYDTGAENRPGSSDSLASTNLMQTLQRSTSGHVSSPSTDSQSASRWGSLISFWGGPRRSSSTDQSDILQSTDDGLGITGVGYKKSTPLSPRKQMNALEQMVHELQSGVRLDGDEIEIFDSSVGNTADSSPEQRPIGSSGVQPSAARDIPERPRAYDSPLKLSVNEKDGIIDVDIPLPEFGSPLQSPILAGYNSNSSLEGSSFGQSSFFSVAHRETEQPVNVAGWLSQFHPDFALQSVKPYANLKEDLKRAMSAEPTPTSSAATPTIEQGPVKRWVEVCSALVADTSTFTVKRIRLRREVQILPTPAQAPATPGFNSSQRSQYGNPYSQSTALPPSPMERRIQEEFIEEPVSDFDGVFVDAVERVLAQSGQPSRNDSASSSRSSSRRGRRDRRSGSDAAPGLEIPRGECRQLVFSALEQVVKSVTAERAAPGLGFPREWTTRSGGKMSAESTLKDGIRRWLSEVEE
ncbi:hypothetical protein BU16DRAFT_419428, partial [Lophium mytilinum]